MLDCRKHLVLEPQPGCYWASKMVLNPAMIQDPVWDNVIHMLFRATGPCPDKQLPGRPLPYPICLGYAVSHDFGENWNCDFSRPALAPEVKYLRKEVIRNDRVNYANGCIEDPRLFYFEKQLYLTVACRVFPPGPYWEKDDPAQCMPEWALSPEFEMSRAVRENCTVSLLYKVNLDALSEGYYRAAFEYVGPVSDPEKGDNRDAFLFPERIEVNGKKQVACLHRPADPREYEVGRELDKPSIFIAYADSIADLPTEKANHQVLATPFFDWESDRIGVSWPPIKVATDRWLLPYHGKQDAVTGYTQSFMILKTDTVKGLVIDERCSERLMYASEPWELGTAFPTPCLFTCSGLLLEDKKLLMGYGAADQKIGMAEVELRKILDKFTCF